MHCFEFENKEKWQLFEQQNCQGRGRKAPQEQSIKINFNIAQPCQYLLSNYINKLVNEINQMTAD